MKKVRAGNILIVFGCVLILAAFVLSVCNIYSSETAGKVSHETAVRFKQHIDEVLAEKNKNTDIQENAFIYDHIRPDITEEKEDVFFEADGFIFTALLNIPALGTELPVCSDLDMDDLRYYPCRYSGKMQSRDMIIAAHNYDSHFGRIRSLISGDEILLTDASGNTVCYNVTETEVINGSAVEDMKAGDWDLTLFTCDFTGNSRITVRCRING